MNKQTLIIMGGIITIALVLGILSYSDKLQLSPGSNNLVTAAGSNAEKTTCSVSTKNGCSCTGAGCGRENGGSTIWCVTQDGCWKTDCSDGSNNECRCFTEKTGKAGCKYEEEN